MSAVYALQYPERVAHLILVSPVGVPKRPPDADKFFEKMNWKRRYAFKTFRAVWSSGFTPQDVVKYAGPKGKDWTSKLVTQRLFRVDDEDPLKPLLCDYLYHSYALPGSGEYALNKILSPGAWAYSPLIERMPLLKKFQSAHANRLKKSKKLSSIREKENENEESENESSQKETKRNESSRKNSMFFFEGVWQFRGIPK